MNNNNDGPIVDPTKKEEVEHPEHVLEALEVLGLAPVDYDG